MFQLVLIFCWAFLSAVSEAVFNPEISTLGADRRSLVDLSIQNSATLSDEPSNKNLWVYPYKLDDSNIHRFSRKTLFEPTRFHRLKDNWTPRIRSNHHERIHHQTHRFSESDHLLQNELQINAHLKTLLEHEERYISSLLWQLQTISETNKNEANKLNLDFGEPKMLKQSDISVSDSSLAPITDTMEEKNFAMTLPDDSSISNSKFKIYPLEDSLITLSEAIPFNGDPENFENLISNPRADNQVHGNRLTSNTNDGVATTPIEHQQEKSDIQLSIFSTPHRKSSPSQGYYFPIDAEICEAETKSRFRDVFLTATLFSSMLIIAMAVSRSFDGN
ncbi:hypothetical protein G9A89_008934 [Geosiphon pyriformis]|nr:hypothetical protein G9A89_008934 [Geosiphon pyriformis]